MGKLKSLQVIKQKGGEMIRGTSKYRAVLTSLMLATTGTSMAGLVSKDSGFNTDAMNSDILGLSGTIVLDESFVNSPNGGCGDGTFGIEVIGASTDYTANTEVQRGMPTGDATVEINLINNSTIDVILEKLHFDAYRRYTVAGEEGWSLVTQGDIDNATVVDTSTALPNRSPYNNDVGVAEDFDDFDVDLSSLTDRTLAVGESANFTLTFKSSETRNGQLWLDNFAVSVTEVEPPALLLLSKDSDFDTDTMQSEEPGITGTIVMDPAFDGSKNRGCIDGTYGTFSGATTDLGSTHGCSITQASSNVTVVVNINNSAATDITLYGFHFDAYRRYSAPGDDGWSLETRGDIDHTYLVDTTTGLLDKKGNYIGNSGADYDDFDVDLSELADRTLAAGESATFTLTFKKNGNSPGSGNLWVDNFAVSFSKGSQVYGTLAVDGEEIEISLDNIVPSHIYTLQYTTDLLEEAWIDVESVSSVFSHQWKVLKTSDNCFYRVVEFGNPIDSVIGFESGDPAGFTVINNTESAAVTVWELGRPHSNGSIQISGGNNDSDYAFGTNLSDPTGEGDGAYIPGTDTSLISPVFDLTETASANLSFAHALNMAANDTAVVNIIDDETDAIIYEGLFTAIDPDPATANWIWVDRIALPPEAFGQAVRFEFRFVGNGGPSGGNLGWYIDDFAVEITGRAPPIVGAIRWDAWYGSGSGDATERSLSIARYHYRMPFFAREIGFNKIETIISQEDVDNEIIYAANAGLDYFCFHWYDGTNGLGKARALYLESDYNHLVKFCLSVAEQYFSDSHLDDFRDLFAMDNYQTVLGNRPLFYVFRTDENTEAAVNKLRNDWLNDPRNTEGAEIYVAWMQRGMTLTEPTINAYSQYAIAGRDGESRQDYAIREVDVWNSWKSEGKVIPLVSAGWDTRPRGENPVSWSGDGENPNKYLSSWFQHGTPEDIANQVQTAIDWCAENEEAEANAVLMYCWNEHDEGGWICPTYHYGPDRLNALANVLGGSRQPVPTPPSWGSDLVKNLGSATASSSQGSNNASKIIDGDDTTYWEAANEDNQWVQIDLGAETPFNIVVLKATELNRIERYTLSYSSDGQTWTDLLEDLMVTPYTPTTFAPVTARYVRAAFTQSVGKPVLHSFEIYNFAPFWQDVQLTALSNRKGIAKDASATGAPLRASSDSTVSTTDFEVVYPGEHVTASGEKHKLIALRDMNGIYVTVDPTDKRLKTHANEVDESALFDWHYHEDGHVELFSFSEQKWVRVMDDSEGFLMADAAAPSADTAFAWTNMGDSDLRKYAAGEGFVKNAFGRDGFNFEDPYRKAPIAVVGPLTSMSTQPANVRVHNVTPNGFSARIDHWVDSYDTQEDVDYFAIPEGIHEVDGLVIEAGYVTANGQPQTVNLAAGFSQRPIVIAQVVSVNDAIEVTHRIDVTGNNTFEVFLQEKESSTNEPADEIVHYIAFQQGTSSNGLIKTGIIEGVTENWSSIDFGGSFSDAAFLADMQTTAGTDTATVRSRNRSATGIEIKIEEETSADTEVSHGAEKIGWVIIKR